MARSCPRKGAWAWPGSLGRTLKGWTWEAEDPTAQPALWIELSGQLSVTLPTAHPQGQPLLLASCGHRDPLLSLPSGCPQDPTASWPSLSLPLPELPSTSDSTNPAFFVSIRTDQLFQEAYPPPCFLTQEGCLLPLPSQVGRVSEWGEDCLGKMVFSVVVATVARCHQEPTREADLPSKKAGL